MPPFAGRTGWTKPTPHPHPLFLALSCPSLMQREHYASCQSPKSDFLLTRLQRKCYGTDISRRPINKKTLYWVGKNRRLRLEEKQCSFKIPKFNSQKPFGGGVHRHKQRTKTPITITITPITDLLPAKALVPVYVKLYGILSSRILWVQLLLVTRRYTFAWRGQRSSQAAGGASRACSSCSSLPTLTMSEEVERLGATLAPAVHG